MQLIDDLRPLSLADYEHVIEMYAAECSAIPGVSAIYQFGSVGAPGLSDIDLMVILDEDAPLDGAELQRLSVKNERWRGEALIRDCFVHDVYVCTRRSFNHIDWLLPGNRWIQRAGVEEHREPPDGTDREIVEIVHGLDFCIERLHELVRLGDGAVRSVRWLVPQLWSLTHTRRMLTDAGAPLERSWGELVSSLEQLRATPPDHIRASDVAALIPMVRAHFESGVEHFAALLAQRAEFPFQPVRESAVASYATRTLHVYPASRSGAAPRASAVALERHFTFAGRTVAATWSRLELPAIVLAHHLAYFSLDERYATVSARLARRSGLADTRASAAYHRVLARRTATMRASEEALHERRGRLALPGIPGLPAPFPARARRRGTWTFRAVRSWLDWRLLPAGVVGIEGGQAR